MMPRRPGFAVPALLLLTLAGRPLAAAEIAIGHDDRVLVLAPHPDDETLGTGGVLQRAHAAGAAVRVAFLTYGDANELSFLVYRDRPVVMPEAVEAMGRRRHDEAVAAARVLGIEAPALVFLGYPDDGLLDVLMAHWGDDPPLQSVLTRVTAVPYASALRPHAPYKGEEILRDLTAVLREFRPTQVFVSHAADRHPDHCATYLFTRVALWDLAGEMHPAVHPYLIHYPHWPERRGLDETHPLAPPAALAAEIPWESSALTAARRAVKLAALRAHATQWSYNADFLASFVRPLERFGDLPPLPVERQPPRTGTPVGGGAPPPAELTDEERAEFVGLEWRAVALDGDALVVTTHLSRPLARAVTIGLDLLGYRPDVPFARMPKLRVRVDAFGHRARNGARSLPGDAVAVDRDLRDVTVRVPLATLGRPRRVLVGARTSLARVALDAVPWRVLELPAP